MHWFFWVLVGFVVNAVIGAAVWAAIDDEQQSVFRWYQSAVKEFGMLGPIMQVLVLQCWLVGLIFWLKNKHGA